MADIKRCWWRTAHEAHGWTEVDGKVVSMVDASTVLQVPPGSKVAYHHCDGIADQVADSKKLKQILPERFDYESRYVVHEEVRRNSKVQLDGNEVVFRVERRVTIEAVYERTVIETPWRETQRITCHCCSCDDDSSSSDPACRNHGFAAVRPCEVHGTPGSVWDDMSLDGEGPDPWASTMPESVQVIRRAQAELRGVDNS